MKGGGNGRGVRLASSAVPVSNRKGSRVGAGGPSGLLVLLVFGVSSVEAYRRSHDIRGAAVVRAVGVGLLLCCMSLCLPPLRLLQYRTAHALHQRPYVVVAAAMAGGPWSERIPVPWVPRAPRPTGPTGNEAPMPLLPLSNRDPGPYRGRRWVSQALPSGKGLDGTSDRSRLLAGVGRSRWCIVLDLSTALDHLFLPDPTSLPSFRGRPGGRHVIRTVIGLRYTHGLTLDVDKDKNMFEIPWSMHKSLGKCAFLPGKNTMMIPPVIDRGARRTGGIRWCVDPTTRVSQSTLQITVADFAHTNSTSEYRQFMSLSEGVCILSEGTCISKWIWKLQESEWPRGFVAGAASPTALDGSRMVTRSA